MIYWDYNATAPLRPKVKQRMSEVLEKTWGNPSSSHFLGQEARALIEKSRREMAQYLGVQPTELIFTASATESNFLALWGMWKAGDSSKSKILVGPTEHPSVMENIEKLQKDFKLQWGTLPLTEEGRIDLDETEKLLSSGEFRLCSLQGASNETGIRYSYEAVAKLCQKYEVPFHSDLVQVFGREDLHIGKLSGLKMATLSFHKSGGPRGVALLYLAHQTAWEPSLVGGSQEKKRRAGTENLLSIAGAAALIEELPELVSNYQNSVRKLRDQFEKELKAKRSSVTIVGENLERLPNTSFCLFPGCSSDVILMGLDVENICASAGSACSSGLSLPAKSLVRLGYSTEEAQRSVRFSMGDGSQQEEIPTVINAVEKILNRTAA